MSTQLSVFLLCLVTFSACMVDVVDENVEQPVEQIVEQSVERDVAYPVDNFEEGILLKRFGTYVNPTNSPVQPERFAGYHTGVDIEVPQDVEGVWVYAIADGEVVGVREVDGYGGVIQVKYEIDGQLLTALYGHLKGDSSLVKVGDVVVAGDRLALLGDPFSNETDEERKHLHFSLKPGLDYDLRGYVGTQEALDGWIDPEKFFEL